MPASEQIFDVAHTHVMAWEGGFFDHPNDPGGVTNYGISLRFLKDLGLLEGDVDGDGDLDRDDILAMSQDRAREIFKHHFWTKPGTDQLPPLIAIAFYDLAVNAGVSRASKVLQQVLGVSADGIIGRKTRIALSLADQAALGDLYMDKREAWYRALVSARPSSNVFLKGWLNRTDACRTLLHTQAAAWGIGIAAPKEVSDTYFKASEFACKCGCAYSVPVSDALVTMLTAARKAAGIPFVISSGLRCPAHNRKIGGVDGSAHTKGLAADITCRDSAARYAMLKALYEAGFRRIELAPTWLHVDIDDDKPQNVAFYPG